MSVSAYQGIFTDFAESFSAASAQREVFEPLSRYEQICREKFESLSPLVSHSVPTHQRSCSRTVTLFLSFIIVVIIPGLLLLVLSLLLLLLEQVSL